MSKQNTGDSTMVQSVSKTYQAHTSTNGRLIITSNINMSMYDMTKFHASLRSGYG